MEQEVSCNIWNVDEELGEPDNDFQLSRGNPAGNLYDQRDRVAEQCNQGTDPKASDIQQWWKCVESSMDDSNPSEQEVDYASE